MKYLEALHTTHRKMVALNNIGSKFQNAFLTVAENQWVHLINMLPSGSGFDSGTATETITDKKIVFKSSYHEMNEHGYYMAWIDFEVTAWPKFGGIGYDFKVNFHGNKRGRDHREYIEDVFSEIFSREV